MPGIFVITRRSTSAPGRMSSRTAHLGVLVIAMLFIAPETQAVCPDPHDLTKSYHPSLEEELRSSSAIVVGTVTEVQELNKDLSDPQGWTSIRYTVGVSRLLKGSVPAKIVLTAQNDSGGYRMSVGEKHLLFLSRKGRTYETTHVETLPRYVKATRSSRGSRLCFAPMPLDPIRARCRAVPFTRQ